MPACRSYAAVQDLGWQGSLVAFAWSLKAENPALPARRHPLRPFLLDLDGVADGRIVSGNNSFPNAVLGQHGIGPARINLVVVIRRSAGEHAPGIPVAVDVAAHHQLRAPFPDDISAADGGVVGTSQVFARAVN